MDRRRRTIAGKAIFTAFLMLLTGLAAARPAEATPSTSRTASTSNVQMSPPKDTKPACPAPTRPGSVSCSALFLTTKRHLAPPTANRPADTGALQPPYTPAALQAAYSLPSSSNGQGQTVAIVDSYDNPNLESDLSVYRSAFSLPPCTTGNGCFQKINQNGTQGSYPKADSGWGGEEDLDVDMVSAVCPNCHIIVVEANSPDDADVTAAEQTALLTGAKFVSNSFGAKAPFKTSGTDPWNHHDGVVVTAATGDWGYGVYYPAAYSNTVAVGGTSLLPAANPRGWSEITWTNAGSGCSTEPKPSWQPDTGCSGHSVADVSAVANPYTGVKVYDSDPGATNGWGQVGGTSASTPIIAATYALAGTPGSAGAASSLYVHSDQLNDVVAGVNSPSGCSPTYLCKAGIGYDGPTGLGTPAGIGAFRPGSDAVTDYAIMGDSYSSGEGLGSYDNGSDTTSDQCHRSSLAFGRLYAASKGNVAVHTACSGATIDNITTTGQNGESPQIARVGSNANLVTVTIGGNDAGFASVLTRCLNPLSGSCEDYYTQGDANDEDNLIDSLEPKLAAAYTAIKNKAPYARVVALTYPSIFKPGTTCSGIANVPVSDVQWLNHETFHLDNAIVRAAQDAGIKVVDERYEFVGHELCSDDPYVYSLPIPLPSGTKVLDSSAWFHPTAEGHAEMASDLAAKLQLMSSSAVISPMAWTVSVKPQGVNINTTLAQYMLDHLRTYATPPSDAYDSSKSYWGWKTGGDCDTRQRVLRNQALKDGKLQPVATAPAPPPWTGLCPVTAGTWELPYDNGTTQQTATYGSTADIAAGIAIDHVVPKADAWNAGFWSYASDPAGQKEIKDFANDVESPELWAVSSSTNSSKQDSRPDQWMPRNTGVECTYAKAWIIVKYEWYLAVLTTPVDANTPSEKDALQNILNNCPSGELG